MFAGIISRDNGSPWGATNLDTTTWMLTVPTGRVLISALTLTQPTVNLGCLIGPPTSYSGDPLPHVIAYGACLYLEDGHHRLVRAIIAGQKEIVARVLRLP